MSDLKSWTPEPETPALAVTADEAPDAPVVQDRWPAVFEYAARAAVVTGGGFLSATVADWVIASRVLLAMCALAVGAAVLAVMLEHPTGPTDG